MATNAVTNKIHEAILAWMSSRHPTLAGDCTSYAFKRNSDGSITVTVDLIYKENQE